ncbi:MAG TPA: 3-hydroxyacyl-ACP dehydratase FabZ [Candidatus Marinimicrobia bacterium]|nr:3-hydroxyacyl-ACP dehydratase FabZ [Candidatus Neomarinimicrobiota bacterium]HIM27206.1 3-hydroxyacyl-ACP dehydratase FabZ [Candidatus Neomarinimicrobiota bacterium]HIN26237.1 3-hydroxyacyl-ACP dehydratase FabZ [Candidatus Neomarinimicrobiota bacterium]
MKILPHRYPMILIDRITEITEGVGLTAIKNVTINEPYFVGHFPGQPVMPAVLILESMAQAGAFLVLNTVPDPLQKNMLFSSISDSKFRIPIIPGDQVEIKMQLIKIRLGAVKLRGEAYVSGKIVAEANLMANIVNRAGA